MSVKKVIIEEIAKETNLADYTLHYFNFRGRAEITRLILAYAGVSYDDHRVAGEQEWKILKPKMPTGQLPTLEIKSGKKLAQSLSIARYLARKHRLTGANAWESAQVDMLVDYITDTSTACFPALFEENAFKKRILMEKVTKIIRPFFDKIESTITENGKGVLVGNQLTWADLYLFTTLDIFYLVDAKMVDGYDNIRKLSDRIANQPGIKAWIEKRPVTPF